MSSVEFSISVSSLRESFETHFAGREMKDSKSAFHWADRQNYKVMLGELWHPLSPEPLEKASLNILYFPETNYPSSSSVRNGQRPHGPDPMHHGPGNKVCATLTVVAAAAGRDHHTFNFWVPLTCLWPHTLWDTHTHIQIKTTHVCTVTPRNTHAHRI